MDGKEAVSKALADEFGLKKAEERIEEAQEYINHIKRQPGGKRKLKVLMMKSGPAVKKSSKALSTSKQLVELRKKRAKGFEEEVEAAKEGLLG